MANTIWIKVDDVLTVLDSFDQIKVYRSATQDGTFAEITTSSTRVDLNSQDNLYKFEDSGGSDDDWYKTSFFNSSSMSEGDQSDAFQAETLQQLLKNMQVVITIDDSIKNTNGQSLIEDLEFYFTTIYDPLYSSIRRIRLDIGKFLTGLPDDTINLAIYEASLEASAITFSTDSTLLNSAFYKHARRQWVTCKAEAILLMNLLGTDGGGLVNFKRLADFQVGYDNALVEEILNRTRECLARWEPQIMTGGRATQEAKHVVKGDRDPDRPLVGRRWETTHFDRAPLGNTKIKYKGKRRALKTYWPRTGWRGYRWWWND